MTQPDLAAKIFELRAKLANPFPDTGHLGVGDYASELADYEAAFATVKNVAEQALNLLEKLK